MWKYLLVICCLWSCESSRSQAAPQPSDQPSRTKTSIATFAGGCFWCLETAFEGMNGVHSVVSGYMDGHLPNPTYKQVSAGTSGHTEVVQIEFDPSRVTYALLLKTFWYNVDPFAKDAQFCDRGTQYRSGIYFHNAAQSEQAFASQAAAKTRSKLKGQFQVEIKPASVFYPAETYHQDYYKKNPIHYKRYRLGCGRDRRLIEIWGASLQGLELQRTEQK